MNTEEEHEEQDNGHDPEWYKTIRASRDYAAEQFDKLIVYISSGGLVLTIGFVKDIVKITDNTDTSMLKSSWIAFTVALLLNLISQITSVKAMDNQLDFKETAAQRWNTATDLLNWSSAFILFGAIGLFIIFVWTNI